MSTAAPPGGVEGGGAGGWSSFPSSVDNEGASCIGLAASGGPEESKPTVGSASSVCRSRRELLRLKARLLGTLVAFSARSLRACFTSCCFFSSLMLRGTWQELTAPALCPQHESLRQTVQSRSSFGDKNSG